VPGRRQTGADEHDLSQVDALPTTTSGDPSGAFIDETTYENLPSHAP
jgi:hypothetical protein